MLNVKQFTAMDPSVAGSLKKFNEACDDMCASRYIIAGAKISLVLRSIAGSRPLYEFFTHATNGFDFIDAFAESKFRDTSGNPYLKPPADPQLQIAYAFCLLYALDTHRLELNNLLHTFYDSRDANEEFSRFCYDIVAPFRDNVNDFITGKIEIRDLTAADPLESVDVAATPEEESESTDEPAEVNVGESENLSSVLAQLTDITQKDTIIAENERDEILVVLESLAEAVNFGEPASIRIMFIAAKNTLKMSTLFPRIQPQYTIMEKLIKELSE